jgi:hypothetical protein
MSFTEGAPGATEIMTTEFFSTLNFDALLRKEIEPPFQPEVCHALVVQTYAE